MPVFLIIKLRTMRINAEAHGAVWAAEKDNRKAGMTGWAQINYPYGASIDDAAWIATGYILAAVIVMPLNGWLTAYFGRKANRG